MIATLLAASILASVPNAVDKLLVHVDACNTCTVDANGVSSCTALYCPPQDPPVELVTRAELDVWTARVVRNEQIRDDLVSCTVESLIGTGGDLLTTGLAWEQCPTCKEANPLGANADARAGLKFGQTGVELGLCLLSAKQRKNTGERGTALNIGTWGARILRGAVVANNLYAALSGKPLLKWGTK